MPPPQSLTTATLSGQRYQQSVRPCRNIARILAATNDFIAGQSARRFIQNKYQDQSTLLPESLDDYAAGTNPGRVVYMFVDKLDLGRLGFDGMIPTETGRPTYPSIILLEIYIYGYLNRIQSSHPLEREAQRNVGLMWLTERSVPDFKTIANLCKDDGTATRRVCQQFVVLCQQLGLFAEARVAIDGSKFKAVNNHDHNSTSVKL